MTTLPNPDDTLVKTTTDNKFIQAKHIYAIAERLTDATEVLEDLCSAVCDRTYSRAKLLQDVAFVKKYVVPLMKDSDDTITTVARILSPIAGVKYVHQRNEKKRKREIVMIENTTLSLNKGMIVQHVNDGIHNNKKDIATPNAKRCHHSRACVSPTDTITLPIPASGKAFNKIEVVNLMSKVPVGHIHAAMAKAIMKHQKQYDVSLSKVSIYCLLTNHANGTVISGEFTGKG